MNVLGIGGMGYKDSAAAVTVDGRLVAAAAEERFGRMKHQGGFPHLAAASCLAEAGIGWGDVDLVAIANNPWIQLRERVVDWYGDSFFESGKFKVYHIFQDEIRHLIDYLKACEDLRTEHGLEVEIVPHHLCHLGSSFLLSPWEEAALLDIDGRGEVSTSAAGIGRGREIQVLHQERMPNSLGLLYAAVTDFLGFYETDDEFRVMSISSLGEPAFLAQLREVVELRDEGSFALNPEYFAYHDGRAFLSDRFSEVFGSARRPGDPVTDRHQDLAASLQRVVEETALHVARALHEHSGLSRLCLSGGVAQNWVFNGALVREGPFAEVSILPTVGDDGTAVGAAVVAACRRGDPRPAPLESSALGPAFDEAAIRAECERRLVVFERPDDIVAAAAEHLAAGRSLGWFQGRMEFGPRALGGRSILADPTRSDTRDRLVSGVKPRNRYHPFGLCLPAERVGEWFETDAASPHMLLYARVRDAARARIPAVVHVDGTVRYHSVARDVEPEFHRLLTEFGERTGVPALLNTSLNRPGEPVACSPADGLDCYFGSGLEALAIGPFLLRKRGIPAGG